MQNKYSDLIGGAYLNLNDYFTLRYDFSADNNLEILNYSNIKTELNINNFISKFEFLEENNDIGTESYLSSELQYNFINKSSLSYNARQEIEKQT